MADNGEGLTEVAARSVEMLMETFPEHGFDHIMNAIAYAQKIIGAGVSSPDALVQQAAAFLLDNNQEQSESGTSDNHSGQDTSDRLPLLAAETNHPRPELGAFRTQADGNLEIIHSNSCTSSSSSGKIDIDIACPETVDKGNVMSSSKLNEDTSNGEMYLSENDGIMRFLPTESSVNYSECESSAYSGNNINNNIDKESSLNEIPLNCDELPLDDEDLTNEDLTNEDLTNTNYSHSSNMDVQVNHKHFDKKNKSCAKYPAKNSQKKIDIENDVNSNSSCESLLEDVPILRNISPKKSKELMKSNINTDVINVHHVESVSSNPQLSTTKVSSPPSAPAAVSSLVSGSQDDTTEMSTQCLMVSMSENMNASSCSTEANIFRSQPDVIPNSRLDLENVDKIELVGTLPRLGQRATVTINSSCQTTSQDAEISAVLTLGGNSDGSSSIPQQRKLTAQQLKSILSSLESKLMMADLSQIGPSTSKAWEDELKTRNTAALKRTTTDDLNPSPTKRRRMVESTQTVDSKSYRDSYSLNRQDSLNEGEVVKFSGLVCGDQQMSESPSDSNLIMMCESCDSSVSLSKCCQCDDAHIICLSCVEEEVRSVMATEKLHMTCPVENCQSVINIDTTLRALLPPLVIDLLTENLRKKEIQASNNAIHKMKGIVTCPSCSFKMLMDEGEICFVCAGHNCNVRCCRYCKAPWQHQASSIDHQFCVMLSFVGKQCLTDITVMPENWNCSTINVNTIQQKDFVKVPIVLTSLEGVALADYFFKTSKKAVKQLWRIQNKKLWERYVLKRMHIEEEINSHNLNERYLFHGTTNDNIAKICKEGFDMRVPVKNGSLFGQGIYFATNAEYSVKFSGKCQAMFMARVICGLATQVSANSNMTRPPQNKADGRIYDSCVDNVKFPNMYVLFDNCQVYPEVVVEF